MKVLGIHHVTAVSAKIVENLAFYTGVLGMRLVKKSVNQDDVSAYHLFYADEVGSPGSDLTFFDWPTIQPNRSGPMTVGLTTLRVPGGSLDWWSSQLKVAEVVFERDTDYAGRERITFIDGEGQHLALIDSTGLAHDVVPWTKNIPAEVAIRGIHGNVYIYSALLCGRDANSDTRGGVTRRCNRAAPASASQRRQDRRSDSEKAEARSHQDA